jgi:hypothetical protein
MTWCCIHRQCINKNLSCCQGMETTLLLQTISKIATLLRIGLGDAGADIISSNLKESRCTSSQ